MLRTTNQPGKELPMNTYTLLYAEDVPHYAHGEVKARGPKDAIARARKLDTDTFTAYEPDWSNAVCRRIVNITDAKGKTIVEDIRLDDYSLEHGTHDEIRIRDNANEILVAFERAFEIIAGIADKLLYEGGEPVTALEAREIEEIYNDVISELAPFETLIRNARGHV
jgi:hypothetical protein